MFFLGKYGFKITDEGWIIFHDLKADAVLTEVPYDQSVFWLASIRYAVEDPANAWDTLGRFTSDQYPDLKIKGRLSGYSQYSELYGRHVDINNHYYCYLYYGESTRDFQIRKRVGGTVTTIGEESVDVGYGWLWCALEIIGTTLNGYRAYASDEDIPDTPNISGVTDTDISNGRWGHRHIGIGYRGLEGLFWFLLQPSSDARKPLKVYEVPVVGEGTDEDPFRPKLPEKLVKIDKVHVLDKRYYTLRKILKNKSFTDNEINEIAEILGLIARERFVNQYAVTHASFIPTPKGELTEPVAIVRIFDVADTKVIDELEGYAKSLSVDDAVRRVKEIDDRLHEVDLMRFTRDDIVKKKAKEYMEWRESQFKVKMDLRMAKHYVRMYKGWL